MQDRYVKFFITTLTLLLSFLILPGAHAQNKWIKMASKFRGDLSGISGTSRTDIFAVGMGGTILHYDGNKELYWQPIINSPTDKKLNAVWAGSKSGVYAVGDGATILFGCKGIHWSVMSVPRSDPPVGNLYGIWGSSGNDVFAVGEKGVILHYDGDGNNDGEPDNIWEINEKPDKSKNDLHSVWGSASNNVFAVGNAGTVRYFNGKSWSYKESNTKNNLHGVWGITGSIIVAVGAQGTILHAQDSGQNWTVQTVGSNNLNGIWGISPGTVHIAGNGGSVFHYASYEAHPRNIPETVNLNAVWVSQNTHVFVVGTGGIIYQQALTGYYWMEGKICSACSGEGIPQATVCEVISPTQCNSLQNGTTGPYGDYGRNQFTARSHTFRFYANDYVTEERLVDLLLNCSISTNTFLFKDPDYKRCIAGVVSKTCDSYDWYIGSPTQSVTVKLDKAIGCEMPGTYDAGTATADPSTGLYHFSNLDDGIYKIKVEADGCSFTPETTCVVTIPLTSRKAHNFKGTGTGLCACPEPSQVPAQCQ